MRARQSPPKLTAAGECGVHLARLEREDGGVKRVGPRGVLAGDGEARSAEAELARDARGSDGREAAKGAIGVEGWTEGIHVVDVVRPAEVKIGGPEVELDAHIDACLRARLCRAVREGTARDVEREGLLRQQ